MAKPAVAEVTEVTARGVFEVPSSDPEEGNSFTPYGKLGSQKWIAAKLYILKSLKLLFWNPKQVPMREHIAKFDEVVRKLFSIGMALDDSDMICFLLLSLPLDFESLVLDFCVDMIPTIDIIKAKLLLKENKRKWDGAFKRRHLKAPDTTLAVLSLTKLLLDPNCSEDPLLKNLDFRDEPFYCDQCEKYHPYHYILHCIICIARLLQHNQNFSVKQEEDGAKAEPGDNMADTWNDYDDDSNDVTFSKNCQDNTDARMVVVKLDSGEDNFDKIDFEVPNKRSKQANSNANENPELERNNLLDGTAENETSDFKPKKKVRKNRAKTTRSRAVHFVCDICQKGYGSKVTFARHWRTHLKEFKCARCLEVFSNQEDYVAHRKTHNTSGPTEECRHCGVEVLKKNIYTHLAREHSENNKEPNVECEHCGQLFPNNRISNHLALKHGGIMLTEECKQCGKVILKFKMKGHLARYHGEKKDPDPAGHLCAICGKGYKNIISLTSHIKNTHDSASQLVACNVCNKMVKGCSLRIHMVVHQEKKFLCTLCGQGFHWRTSLATHMQTHGIALPFACSMCDRRVLTALQLERHMARHSKNKPFRCPHCEKAFTANTSLMRHISITHEGNSHSCNVCQKEYKQKQSLMIHMQSHQRPDSISCVICNMNVVVGFEMQRHLKAHAAETEFECLLCCLGFDSKRALNKHYKSSTHMLAAAGTDLEKTLPHIVIPSLQCKICLLGLNTQKSLKKHYKQVHPGYTE